MASVTQRIKEVKQPYGGYLPIKNFEKTQLEDDLILEEDENIHTSLVGLCVDYLSRYKLGETLEESFKISLLGADIINKQQTAYFLLSKIRGLDDVSIECALKLTGFDVCFRSGVGGYKDVMEIQPNKVTINNIRKMVARTVAFFESNGPVISTNLTFEGGYSKVVNAGDGDFLTKDTIWDLKVIKGNSTSKHTLQILMYYIMGLKSVHKEYQDIKYLGMYNPRRNMVYRYDVSKLSKDVFDEVADYVIGYNLSNYITETDIVIPQEEFEREYTLKEITDYYNIPNNRLRLAIRRNELKAYKKKNKYYVSEYELEKFLNKLRFQNAFAITFSIIIVIVAVLFMLSL